MSEMQVPSREDLVEAITNIYAARLRKEYDTVVAGFAPNARVTLVGAPDMNPFSGTFRGHEQIKQALLGIDAQLDIRSNSIEAILIDLPNIAVRWHCSGTLKTNGAAIEEDCFDHLHVVDGLIAEYTEFFDTANVGIATQHMLKAAI